MNRCTAYAVAVLVGASPLYSIAAAEPDEEQRLLSILQSDKPASEKDAACSRLKRIGTARSVPALGALLTDEELSHSARYALESMPRAEAGDALRRALAKTTGRIRAGIIDSLGDRRERRAVGSLAKLLSDADAMVASSAATALGKIGGPEALRALRAALPQAPAAVRPAVADATLLCADRLLAEGDRKAASAVYMDLYDSKLQAHVRVAAYRGLVLAAGDRGVALVTAALAGGDRAAQLAALQLVREIEGPAATKAFAALLASLPPARQVALLEALRQRGDPAALPAVMAAARAPAPEVRAAAIQALGELGDASAVALLAESAASAKGDEQMAARQSLARLRGTAVRQAILAHLPKAKPPVQLELARALGRRGDTSAVSMLLKMAESPEEPVQLAAIQAVAMLADDGSVGKLLALLVAAKTRAVREAIEKALVSLCGRSRRPEALAATVLAARKGASVPARCALLRLAGRIGGADALKALRAALGDQDPAIRDAALRTMADSAGVGAAGDLLRLARESASLAHRVIALRGYWRLVGLAGDRPAADRLKMCESGLAVTKRPEEKKLALAELAKVPHLGALKLAESLCKDAGVAAEAETACVRIAALLQGRHPAEARAALRRIADHSKSAGAREEARKALDAMDRYVGYVTAWLVAGPYRQKGKQCSELFDIALGPERPGAEVAWRPAPAPADAALFWQADLAGVVGGDHCVVYLKARVHAPRTQRVRLDIGTDDGVKMWINGKLIHANNAIRGLQPAQDRAQGVLKEGDNDFLLKITQHTLGCGACVRIRGTDGAIIEGLRFGDTAGAPKASRP